MKQKIQSVIESLHDITNHLDGLREIAIDLSELRVPCQPLDNAILEIYRWRQTVNPADPSNLLVGTRRLREPVPPGRRLADHRDPYGNPEDAPCIACGAPEGVCECGPDAVECADAEAQSAFGHNESKARRTS